MVFVTGFVVNVNHITLGTDTTNVLAGMACTWHGWRWSSLCGLIASPFTIRHPRAVQRGGRALVGHIKAFMEWWNPRATYSEKDISVLLDQRRDTPVPGVRRPSGRRLA